MERVRVVKPMPGILNVGDILVSPAEGADFCLEEVNVTNQGSNERYVSLDYVTVSENIPQFFQLEQEDELELELEIESTQCVGGVERSDREIEDRYIFFKRQFEEARPNSEAQVVYKNLVWFIEWLQGKAEIYLA